MDIETSKKILFDLFPPLIGTQFQKTIAGKVSKLSLNLTAQEFGLLEMSNVIIA